MNAIHLSQRHVVQHDVIYRLIRRIISEREASELLGKSIRQVRRLKKKLLRAVEGVIDSQAYILGPDVDIFEREFAVYCGVNRGHKNQAFICM